MKVISDIKSLQSKTVIVRVDYNVPIADGSVQDNTRILDTLPTLEFLIKRKCKIILLSHLGRPNGYDEKLSLKVLTPLLSQVTKTNVILANLEDLYEKVEQISSGEIVLMENIRFYPEEEKNDIEFAQRLSYPADLYVNEAFSCSHRQHASISALSSVLPALAGIKLYHEVKILQSIFEKSCGPIAAVVGGSKISTKLKLIKSLSKKVQYLIVGGALANNILQARGLNIGTSLVEHEIHEAFHECENIILPQDVVTSSSADASEIHTCDVRYVPQTESIFDIGPASIMKIKNILQECKTVIWNGPLGFFEKDNFGKATQEVANEIVHLTQRQKIRSIIGGGDSIFAINKFGINKNNFTHVSTAGGAFLEWLESQGLENLKVLER